jgi:transposase, IS30 family
MCVNASVGDGRRTRSRGGCGMIFPAIAIVASRGRRSTCGFTRIVPPPIGDAICGDWEGDTVVGRGHQGGAVTLVDRKSGYLLIARVCDRHAVTVREAMVQLFQPSPQRLRKTLPLDNGKAFAEHEQLAATTALQVYFAKPYCARQRGTNENANGLVRQFFSKGSDMAHVPAKQFEKAQHLLNNRPRRCLGYRTPQEILSSRLRCD